jgi:hypothetical protein
VIWRTDTDHAAAQRQADGDIHNLRERYKLRPRLTHFLKIRDRIARYHYTPGLCKSPPTLSHTFVFIPPFIALMCVLGLPTGARGT